MARSGKLPPPTDSTKAASRTPRKDAAASPGPQADPALPFSHPLRVATLPTRKPTRFQLDADTPQRVAIAQALGLIDLPALRFKGELTPSGSRDFLLTGWISAQAVQACSVTLEPVPASIGEEVRRHFTPAMDEPVADEMEIPEDDSLEPLAEVIDLGAIAVEALALALPPYPRKPGAELVTSEFAPPGAEPIAETERRPFAGLAALKSKLEGQDPEA